MIVAAPDGKTIDFGDMPDDQVQSAMQGLYPVQQSTASDIAKSAIGNVAPNAVANYAANVASIPYTVGSYALQGGVKASEYATERASQGIDALMGNRVKPMEEYESEQKDLMNAIRGKIGLDPTSSGDLSNAVPTPSNLLNAGMNAMGTPLYQPQTEAGKQATMFGNVATGGAGSGASAMQSLMGAAGATAGQYGLKQAGAPEDVQFLGSLAGGLGMGAMGSRPPAENAVTNKEAQTTATLMGANKPIPLPKLDPTDVVREHASSLDAARNVGGEISQNMEKVAGNDTVVAPQAQEHVQALLDQVKQNEFPVKNKAQAVKILNGVLENFGDNGEMQVSDAMKISKLANESYDPTNVQYKGYWGNAKSAADDVMDAYSAQNPHFSALRDLQRDHYANNVGNAFEDNGVAQKYFDKQDFQNVKNTDEGKIDYLNPDTQAKMDSMIGRVRNANDYVTLRRGINDPDVAQQFDNAVAEKIMPGRAKLFWEGVRGSVQRGEVPSKGSVVQGALRAAFPESSMSPEEVGIMNAMKEANTTPTKSSTFANKQASDSIMQDWAAKQANDAQVAAQTDAYNRMNTKLLTDGAGANKNFVSKE